MNTFSFARANLSEFLLGVRRLNEITSYNLGTDESPKDKGKRAAPPLGPVMCLGCSQASLPLEARLHALLALPKMGRPLMINTLSSRMRGWMCFQLRKLNKNSLSILLKTRIWDITSEVRPEDQPFAQFRVETKALLLRTVSLRFLLRLLWLKWGLSATRI